MNEIEAERANLKKFFDPNALLPDTHQTELSPSDRYQLQIDDYRQNAPDLNWHVHLLAITEKETGKELLRVKCGGEDFHTWIESENADYFLFAETLGGQSVFDLRKKELVSYYDSDEPFIWVSFYPSPDLQKIVIEGCYWACPFEFITYDFSGPLALPLPELNREIIKRNEVFDSWLNDSQFQLRDSETTRIITIP